MSYQVKEIFYSLQGEGLRAGRPAVFLRFAGCNLWSGREADRASAICNFCDTDFVGTDGTFGGHYRQASDLARQAIALWPAQPIPGTGTPVNGRRGRPYVVCTGGEPLLQLDRDLLDALHQVGFEIAVETNGTIEAPQGIDWICVSPKARAELRQRRGNELKLVFPQAGCRLAIYEGLDFDHFLLQPLDGADRAANIQACLEHCLRHPQWRLSLQTHKWLDIR